MSYIICCSYPNFTMSSLDILNIPKPAQPPTNCLKQSYTARLLFGQYSAYSSQVHPVFVQHSAVIEPDPCWIPPAEATRRRPRRERNIWVAVSRSSQGSESVANHTWWCRIVELVTLFTHNFSSQQHADHQLGRPLPRGHCAGQVDRCRCRKPKQDAGPVCHGTVRDSRDARLFPSRNEICK